MDIAAWVGTAIGAIGLVFAGVTLHRQIESTTSADRERAAERVDTQIKDARQEERDKCTERTRRLLDQLGEMTSDRDYQRERAEGLQTLINKMRMGGDGE